MSENEEFIREFLEECEENLDQLDKDLVSLEQNPRDSKRLESIFRTIHTIKGTCGFFGFAKLGGLAHDGESLLGRLRDGELRLNQQIASTLLRLMDAIRDMLRSIGDNGSEGSADHRELSAELIRLALSTGDASTTDPPAPAEAESEPLEVSEFSDLAADAEAIVAAADGGTEPAAISPRPVVSLRPLDIPPPSLPASESTPPKLQPESMTEEPATTTEDPSAAAEPSSPWTEPETASATTLEGSIRVDVRLLDELLDLAGELVLARNQLNQLSDSLEDAPLLKAIQRLSQITTELQEGVMQTRMQPMSTIWRKFPRVIRDLAVACGKEIELLQEGEETELDRSLLEAIKDPLTHLIRNAVDHGIESPQTRVARGKSRKGRVVLRAYHEGGQVNIDIEDDGGGIDVQRVKRRAVERGLIGGQQAELMSEQDLVQLIFRPGFSTAEKVTDVSGRGVGMDVVKTNIERIGGSFSVQNRSGLGTNVRITIPLTLAIVPALVVTAGGHRFAIPQVGLNELLNYDAAEFGEKIEWVHDAPVCRLRGRLLPLVYLHQILELEQAPTTHTGYAGTNIVVVQAEGCRFGLVVDRVINTEEIVVKALSRAFKSLKVFAGATIMGDGAVALILDVVGLARRAGLTVARKVAPAADKPAAPIASHPYLLCESADQRRVAIRLAEVHRLEEFSPRHVERAAATEAVQYGGQIMPLVRLSGLLGWPEETTRQAENLRVVIHRQSGRDAGLVVPRIVDIVEGPHRLDDHTSDSPVIVGSSLIEGRVTAVIDLNAAVQMARERSIEPVGNSS